MDEQYFKLYDWVLCRNDLSSTEKIVLTIIQALSAQNGNCNVGDGYLAEKAGVTKRMIRLIIKKLEEGGFIIRDEEHGRRTIIPVEREYIH